MRTEEHRYQLAYAALIVKNVCLLLQNKW